MRQRIQQRTRFFVAVEGESEQSFVAWLQTLAGGKNLPVHLDGVLLGGGGFSSMLKKAVSEHKRRSQIKGAYTHRFLIVDEDRAEQGDWPIEQLRQEALKNKIVVCIQRPNHEGLLYRLKAGFERDFAEARQMASKLRAHWPTYEKPVNAQKLQNRFSLDDLLRAATADSDLAVLLRAIGLLL